MPPKKKTETSLTPKQQRGDNFFYAGESMRKNVISVTMKAMGEDKTYALNADKTGQKVTLPGSNKSSIKAREDMMDATEKVPDSMGREIMKSFDNEEVKMCQEMFLKDGDTRPWSIEEVVKILVSNAKDPNSKPRIKLMDESIPVDLPVDRDSQNKEFSLMEESSIVKSLQRDLCWSPKQLNYYIMAILNWKGSSSGNASVLPLPLPPILMYHDEDKDEYQIFAGQHRFIYSIAFYLGRIPVVGASNTDITGDSRFLFQDLPPHVKWQSKSLYPPGCKNWTSYWNLVKQKIITPDGNNVLSQMFRSLDAYIEGVTQKKIEESYQTPESSIMCYNYLNKSTTGHLETYEDAMEQTVHEDGTKSYEQKSSEGFRDWHSHVGEMRMQFTIFKKSDTDIRQVKVLSNLDNVRISRESLGVWFLQTPSPFNDTLKRMEPSLVEFLKACSYPDGYSPYIFYEHNEFKWVLASRLLMCLQMGFGTLGKPTFSYADLSYEMEMFREVIGHDKFVWGDVSWISHKVSTTLHIMTEVVKLMNQQRQSTSSEYLYSFFYDERKFFAVAIVVYHWVGLLPSKDKKICFTDSTYNLIRDICISAFMMTSVVFSYSMANEKKRIAGKDNTGERIPIDDLPFEYHVDLKTLAKPGQNGSYLDEENRGDLYFIYEFLQKSTVDKHNLTNVLVDEDLGLFKCSSKVVKETWLEIKDGKFVNRPLDICAHLMKDSSKTVDTYQRSSIGIFANMVSAAVHRKYYNKISRLVDSRIVSIPDHYVKDNKDMLFVVVIEPDMQEVTQNCVSSRKTPQFTTGAHVSLEVKKPARKAPTKKGIKRKSTKGSSKKPDKKKAKKALLDEAAPEGSYKVGTMDYEEDEEEEEEEEEDDDEDEEGDDEEDGDPKEEDPLVEAVPKGNTQGGEEIDMFL
jgi:hypothetical protein